MLIRVPRVLVVVNCWSPLACGVGRHGMIEKRIIKANGGVCLSPICVFFSLAVNGKVEQTEVFESTAPPKEPRNRSCIVVLNYGYDRSYICYTRLLKANQ